MGGGGGVSGFEAGPTGSDIAGEGLEQNEGGDRDGKTDDPIRDGRVLAGQIG